VSDTTDDRGICGHDHHRFADYATGLPITDAAVAAQIAACGVCWADLASLTRIWSKIQKAMSVATH
jgi:hypothetical protein